MIPGAFNLKGSKTAATEIYKALVKELKKKHIGKCSEPLPQQQKINVCK